MRNIIILYVQYNLAFQENLWLKVTNILSDGIVGPYP